MSNDPFGDVSTPSVSFKDMPIGTSYTLEVLEAPSLVQSRNYESGQPDFWPDGNPKMSVVTKVINKATGETLSLWAPKPSAMYAALGAAQKAAGGDPIAKGGTITVTFTGEKPSDNPRLNAQKLYSASYTPPPPVDAFAAADPWQAAAPAAQQVAQAQAPMVAPQTPVQQAAAQQPVAQAAPAAVPGQPTPEQIAAVRAAGQDPATIWPHLAAAGQAAQPPF